MNKDEFIKQFVVDYMSKWCLESAQTPYGTNFQEYKSLLGTKTFVAIQIANDIWNEMEKLK